MVEQQHSSGRQHIAVDCIPDVHFSKHIIPPLLAQLQETRYDLLFVECGIPPDTVSELNPEADGLALFQREVARRNGTLDVYERLVNAVRAEPICIDHPLLWMRTAVQTGALLTNKGVGTWGDPSYQAAISRYVEETYPQREIWMLRQIKSLVSLAGRSSGQQVRALLLIGHLHAPVLAFALKNWCDFQYLPAFSAVKIAVIEHHKGAGVPVEQLRTLQEAGSLRELRQAVLHQDMLSFGIPVAEADSLYTAMEGNLLKSASNELFGVLTSSRRKRANSAVDFGL